MIDNQFKLGQEVFVASRFHTRQICTGCNGKGEVVLANGTEMTCWYCDGIGSVEGGLQHKPVKVHIIAIILDEDVFYLFAEHVSRAQENKIFLNEAECQEYCDKLNGAL